MIFWYFLPKTALILILIFSITYVIEKVNGLNKISQIDSVI